MSKSLVIITGGSRGIGRAIALAISEAVAVVDKAACSSIHSSNDGEPPLLTTTRTMILISRSADALQETARLVEERGRGMVTAQCHCMDLSNLDTIVDDFSSVLEKISSSSSSSLQYESCWLVNNAGSLGPVGLASSFSSSCGESMKELRRAVDLNLTSSIWLSSQFTKNFLTISKSVRIVNISSLCALEPFPTMSIYCAGKAGRDMFHSVLAKEHKSSDDGDSSSCQQDNQRPSFKVLNYAPGPCDTEMTDYLAEDRNINLDEGIQQYFATSKKEQTLIRPEDTAKKLIRVLTLDEFESGSHVDYFDSKSS